MPFMAVAKAIVGKKIPRLHGRAGSIPALGTISMFKDVLGRLFSFLNIVKSMTYSPSLSFGVCCSPNHLRVLLGV